jgi:AraC-like DNA-binding protein
MSSYQQLRSSRSRLSLAYVTNSEHQAYLCMVLPVKGINVLAVERLLERAPATPRSLHRDLEELLQRSEILGLSMTVRSALRHAVNASTASHGVRKRTFKGGLAPWQLRIAKESLSAELHVPINLADLASACRVSHGHFARAFRVSVGLSPTQWRVEQRLEYCRSRLSTSDDSIASIALAAGFLDQSSFSRVFIRACGMSPTDWRRAFRSALRASVGPPPGVVTAHGG